VVGDEDPLPVQRGGGRQEDDAAPDGRVHRGHLVVREHRVPDEERRGARAVPAGRSRGLCARQGEGAYERGGVYVRFHVLSEKFEG